MVSLSCLVATYLPTPCQLVSINRPGLLVPNVLPVVLPPRLTHKTYLSLGSCLDNELSFCDHSQGVSRPDPHHYPPVEHAGDGQRQDILSGDRY